MKQTKFDFLVIGGGSGGLAAAKKAASYGAKVALIEMGRLGGTCVNLGCVPKKITWYASQLAECYHFGSGYGFHCDDLTFDFEKLVIRREKFIKTLNQIYEQQLKKNGVSYIKGCAQFLNPNSIVVDDESYTAQHILIATGSYPTKSLVKGANLGIDSDGFFALENSYQKKLRLLARDILLSNWHAC